MSANEETTMAAARVRRFVEAREAHYTRRATSPAHIRLSPDSILAEYGRLDMADLALLCDAASERSAG